LAKVKVELKRFRIAELNLQSDKFGVLKLSHSYSSSHFHADMQSLVNFLKKN